MADRVYHDLLEKILHGAFVPGETIDRVNISKALNVSLAPVAQALARLTSEGLVETVAGRHTRVRLVRFEDVRGEFALRMALERQAVAMTSAEQFRRHADRLKALAREVDMWPAKEPQAWPAELAFHMAIVDLAECSTLSESYRRVMRRNYFFSLHSASIHPKRQPSADQPHSRLVDSLCLDDRTVADRVFVAHFAGDLRAFDSPTGSIAAGEE